ncbi:MAG: STAS/SEC14 domain-containing protein [Cyclobacteriaceae bacterium]|nr:STAS/SEC14 domain-containing protein [Cyclobacteriaceae bacterium]
MIEKIEKFDTNTLAFEIIDGFTETDQKLAEKFFQQKLDQGYDVVNMLIKMDEAKIGSSSIKAFMEDAIWVLRKYKKLGNIAIVAHSNIVKALVPIDKFFFERIQKGYEERYFDASQFDKAVAFIKSNE